MIAEWVKRSTAAQGIKEKADDGNTIIGLVQLLRAIKLSKRSAMPRG